MRTLLPLLLLGCADPMAQFPCGTTTTRCQVDQGEYAVELPKGFDPDASTPAFLHLHGYGGSAVSMASKDSFTRPMARTGWIAIYPDGFDNSWAHEGSPTQGRDEVAYLARVIEDAAERFPIDRQRIVVSGFSQGGSMATYLACRTPDLALAFAPISGGFWEPVPDSCQSGPFHLRHEHGTADTVFPLQGRSIGRDFRQADVSMGFDILASSHACGPPRQTQDDERTCTVWDDCADGSTLQLCLHDGDHRVTDGWHQRTVDWVDGL